MENNYRIYQRMNNAGRWKNPVTRDQLLPFVAAGSKQEDIAKALVKHNSTICSALKKFGLTIPSHRILARDQPVCAKCGCQDEAKFRKRAGAVPAGNPKGRWCSWCVQCMSENVNAYKQKNRARIVSFLGGKCVVCGFSKYMSALDAHHVDQAEKDVSASNMIGWRWERLEKELRGCVLLCSNCHRGHHTNELSAEDEAKIVAFVPL